jgi:hypothetical protein
MISTDGSLYNVRVNTSEGSNYITIIIQLLQIVWPLY